MECKERVLHVTKPSIKVRESVTELKREVQRTSAHLIAQALTQINDILAEVI